MNRKYRDSYLSAQYAELLNHHQKHMAPAEKLLSHVMHNCYVERVSDIAAKTILRPHALLLGCALGFFGLVCSYAYAKFIGLELSGSETISSFLLGWACGNLYDLFAWLFRKKD